MSKVATEAGYFHEGMLLKEQPADYYRTTADRYRKLLAEDEGRPRKLRRLRIFGQRDKLKANRSKGA